MPYAPYVYFSRYFTRKVKIQYYAKKTAFLQKIEENRSGKHPGLGSGGGSVVAIFTVTLIQRFAQKLHRIILLHSELITVLIACRIHFGNTRKVIIFMVSGTGRRDHDSPNQLFLNLEKPIHFNQSKKTPNHFEQILFWKYEILITQIV